MTKKELKEKLINEIRAVKASGVGATTDSERGAISAAVGKLVVRLRKECDVDDKEIAEILEKTN